MQAQKCKIVGTCFTKLNPNTFLYRREKLDRKFQIVVVLVSQILMNYLYASNVSQKCQLKLVLIHH